MSRTRYIPGIIIEKRIEGFFAYERTIGLSERNELLKIIASQLNNTAPKVEVADWRKLLKLAKAHGLLQYIAFYAEDLPEDKRPDEKVQNYLFSAIMQETARSANQLDAVAEMQEAMEQNGVYNLAVKGSVTKMRYENELLRTMGDIDLLYKPEQHHFFMTLMLSLGYGDYQEGRKNDTYSRPPFITVEAHRELVTSESDCADYYRDIWNMAQPKDGLKYTYEMRVEDELVFNIVHLAEHFKEGGAGVRFIIDVYVYSRIEMDNDYVEHELTKLSLNEFYHHILDLANYWLADSESSELTEKLADFIMDSGVFGDKDNAAALAVEEGRIKHFFKVCFPDYDSMKSMFPWLEGREVLLPYAWGLRGVRALRYRKGNVDLHFSQVRTGDTEKGKALRQFYSECGLK